MPLPTEDSAVTQAQVNAAVNLANFPGAVPGEKGWHYGQLEGWAFEFGYPEGIPIYAECVAGGASYHIYWLNDGHQAPIILGIGQTPATYGVMPQ
ncbi:hypothetical protein [Primorskyibacter sp. 2E233]|uniref:hypothetical protein n=1 Tax=Primorskyibacter sp. 2E233 TaxID=3413431 RepID=UPI003BF32546